MMPGWPSGEVSVSRKTRGLSRCLLSSHAIDLNTGPLVATMPLPELVGLVSVYRDRVR